MAEQIAPSSTSEQSSLINPTQTPFSRVTRSAARLAADSNAAAAATQVPRNLSPPPQPTPASRKRKAARREPSPEVVASSSRAAPAAPVRRSKRQRVEVEEAETVPPPVTAPSRPRRKRETDQPPNMSTPGSSEPTGDGLATNKSTSSSKRKSARGKKNGQDGSPSAPPKPSTRSKKVNTPKAENAALLPAEEIPEIAEGTSSSAGKVENENSDEGDGDIPRDFGQDDDDEDNMNPFRSGLLGRPGGGPGGLSSTLRALTGMVSGVSTRLRNILENLRQKGDPSVQLIALQELSEVLLVSTEDTLAGHFAPDQYVKELVSLMKSGDFDEGNPEMMLLACRCIANLMEALPQATANVVYGGAVPILCSKLLEIQFIDLAEQALSTLEKISVEFPASIVREGGLTACLTFLDFFATSTQRTAVTTAANCCRNLSEDSFPTVRDVMPILLNVLSSNDQKVVEQGSLCVSRIVESFKYQPEKLEELISSEMLKAILGLLLPGTTNLIGPKIHTQFLRLLAITARASPSLSVALLKMDVIDTLYQILTGVSPPEDSIDVASKIDSVLIMQALIHRPKEQIFETLNVICELLPKISTEGLALKDQMLASGVTTEDLLAMSSASRSEKSPNSKRMELLKDCQPELRRFATILLPTLTHAYSSTVNLNVRQKVLAAQLKMISNLEIPILEDALQSVPYASYLASILSQQDHPMLVMFALQAAELLLVRMESIYRYQFHREGVINEITKLASQPRKQADKTIKIEPDHSKRASILKDPEVKLENDEAQGSANIQEHIDEEDDEQDSGDPEGEDRDEDGEEINEGRDGGSRSPSTSSSSSDHHYAASSPEYNLRDYVIRSAKNFIEVHEKNGKGAEMGEKADRILDGAQSLAKAIRGRFLGNEPGDAKELFTQLSHYFSGNALESITSSELLNSEIVDVLLDVLECPDEPTRKEAQIAFLEVFMSTQATGQAIVSSSSFGVLVHKLQDLFSREEHFEVVTVHHNALDSNRSSAASMLAKQLRLKLVADEDSGIPRSFRHIMVSIHAIATFKALDDYLRPRISLSDRPRGGRHHDVGVSGALAAFAAAAGLPNAHQRLADRGFLGTGVAAPVPAPSNQASTPIPSRKTPKEKSSKPTNTLETPTTQPITAEKPSMRRSNRRTQVNQTPATPVQAPPSQPPPEEVEEALECADERQLVDEDDMDGGSALDAFVDDLEDEMENADLPDPSAVNLEVAATGKVTARQEDGTRIPTPSQPANPTQPPSFPRLRVSQANPSTPSNLDRMSYSAAIQSVPQDWHMEFSINDEPISNETTIYRAVHRNSSPHDEVSSRNLWSGTHTIKIRKVTGPPPPESSLTPPPDQQQTPSPSGMPLSLQQHPTTASILRLLDVMHKLNADLDHILGDSHKTMAIGAEPLAQFVNTKLTAKLNRQLEEPLIVASNCLPTWSEDLARLYPFLFPFETRHLFLQSTSFGYSRSMSRWQNAQSTDDSRRDRHRDERPFLGRLQRQKVRISRSRILESAVKVMELYGASPSVLEVEYFEEVGTGLGPTLEFYSTVSREFSRKKIKLWRENESTEKDEFAFGISGLFPSPMSTEQAESENGQKSLNLFKMLGKFVARSMLDSRIIDVSFNPMFFRVGDSNNPVSPSFEALKSVDKNLASSLKLLKQFSDLGKQPLARTTRRRSSDFGKINNVSIDDLALDFTLPGYPEIELVRNGSDILVTLDNVGDYIDKVLDLTLGSGVQRQIEAFRAGFSQVFPYTALRAFTPSELVMLFGRVEEDWSTETLMDSIKADHGFNMDSRSVRNLLTVMSELTLPQRRDFLQFVTGSPKLPIGGFKSLTPMFTVVCKPSEPPYTSDDYLPSVMTCVNYLKLPDYTDLDMMRKRLYTAIREGQGAFHLS